MDIFDILLDILLKPPQPFIGLFFLLLKMLQKHVLHPWLNLECAFWQQAMHSELNSIQ